MVGHHPIDAGDDDRHPAAAVTAEDPHRHNRCGLGDAGCDAGDGARNVRTVTVAVVRAVAVTDAVEACGNATTELHVRGTHTGVDDVGANTLCAVVVRVGTIKRESTLVDAIKTP